MLDSRGDCGIEHIQGLGLGFRDLRCTDLGFRVWRF